MPDMRDIGSMMSITSKGPGENKRWAASTAASSIVEIGTANDLC
jgi:hypothetical protein